MGVSLVTPPYFSKVSSTANRLGSSDVFWDLTPLYPLVELTLGSDRQPRSDFQSWIEIQLWPKRIETSIISNGIWTNVSQCERFQTHRGVLTSLYVAQDPGLPEQSEPLEVWSS